MQNGFPQTRLARLRVPVLMLTMTVQIAQAEQPIQKALGQTLGAVFDPKAATRSEGGADAVTFWYPAPGEARDVTEFYVLVSPLSYRIFAIVASGEQSEKISCQHLATVTFGKVADKYYGKQYDGDLRELPNGEGYLLIQRKTDRRVHVGCEEKGSKTNFMVVYLDDKGNELAKSEARELSRLNEAFEAKNYSAVTPRVQELAKQGNLWAETMLGLMYGHGYGVPRDEDVAEDYYLRAAQRSWLGAEYNLGTFYYERFRYKQAELWLTKAAEREYPQAEENLAQVYLAKGPLQSEDKAFIWFLRAAEHGQPESQYNTCYAYADGLGVKRDLVEAYKWCYIAAHNGQKQAGRNKDHLAAQMQPGEVVRGREAAELWLARHGSGKQ